MNLEVKRIMNDIPCLKGSFKITKHEILVDCSANLFELLITNLIFIDTLALFLVIATLYSEFIRLWGLQTLRVNST